MCKGETGESRKVHAMWCSNCSIATVVRVGRFPFRVLSQEPKKERKKERKKGFQMKTTEEEDPP